MKYLIFIFVFSLLLNFGCKNINTQKAPLVIRADSFSGTIVADTIIYDVIINNPNPDDSWTSECLKDLKHSTLVDSLFYLAYSGKAITYDFFSKELLQVVDIKRMEKEENNDRTKIGKIQFTERWYFDVSTQQFQKEVISIVMGYELVNDDGMVRGYKPVFMLQLNH